MLFSRTNRVIEIFLILERYGVMTDKLGAGGCLVQKQNGIYIKIGYASYAFAEFADILLQKGNYRCY